MLDSVIIDNHLDKEWVTLILQARELGMSIDEIREFLHQQSLRDK